MHATSSATSTGEPNLLYPQVTQTINSKSPHNTFMVTSKWDLCCTDPEGVRHIKRLRLLTYLERMRQASIINHKHTETALFAMEHLRWDGADMGFPQRLNITLSWSVHKNQFLKQAAVSTPTCAIPTGWCWVNSTQYLAVLRSQVP